MFSRLLCVALLATATAASAQTLYRTVTGNGKVVFSDTPVSNDSVTRPSQVTTYSSGDLSAANVIQVAAGGDGAGGSAGDQACRADVQKYCARSGEGKEAFECLLDHQQDVSEACYDAMKQRVQSGGSQDKAASGPPGGQACRQDAQQLCKGVQPGGGRIINCLRDHQKELSDACYDTLAKKRQGGRP